MYVVAGINKVGKSSLMIFLMDELSGRQGEDIVLYFYTTANIDRLPAESDRIKLVEMSELLIQTGIICLESEWAKSDHGLSAVIVDDYRFMLRTERFSKLEFSKNEKILYLLTRLKTIAEVYDVPVIITCGVDDDYIYGRSNKKPLISDIWEYQYIEALADRIVMMHRAEMFDAETDNKGVVELQIISPRDDSRYDCSLAYISEFGKFCEI